MHGGTFARSQFAHTEPSLSRLFTPTCEILDAQSKLVQFASVLRGKMA